MKKCFKCGIEKELSEFYVHPQMGDGHLNKCKDCTKKDVKIDYKKNIKDPIWHQKQKARGRDKYRRLNYNDIYKIGTDEKRIIMKKHNEKYPEKYIAKFKSVMIKAPVGFEKHHWSYNKEHYKDVLFLTREQHNIAHRYMVYDQERMMYRTISNVLLDTKESHEIYINQYIIL